MTLTPLKANTSLKSKPGSQAPPDVKSKKFRDALFLKISVAAQMQQGQALQLVLRKSYEPVHPIGFKDPVLYI